MLDMFPFKDQACFREFLQDLLNPIERWSVLRIMDCRQVKIRLRTNNTLVRSDLFNWEKKFPTCLHEMPLVYVYNYQIQSSGFAGSNHKI